MRGLAAFVATLCLPAMAQAQLWEDVTTETIGETIDWTNKVDLADLDGDGLVDILFANGGLYSKPGDPESNQVFLNRGAGQAFEDVTDLLGAPDSARVVKAQDVNGDGAPDIFVGAVYQTQSRLYLGDGLGGFSEVTASNLPQKVASVGDIEFGDVDADGDLDVVLADWGPGDPFESDGGRVQLWLNDGSGVFSDATEANMPVKLVRWSWDLELIDLDNDYDLDIIVSCKVCEGGALYHNTGAGVYTDESQLLPQFTNNYEFEAADLNGDGFLDVITINDGDQIGANQFNKREHIFTGNGRGFDDSTAELWPNEDNVGADDNAVVILDFDSDGDPDFLIASLDGADRLLINDGSGHVSLDQDVFGGERTPGTLGIALADLNGDGKLDVVQSQGELAEDERVYFGTGIAADTAAPAISLVSSKATRASVRVRARIHDNKSPVKPFDFQHVEVVTTTAGVESRQAMQWYGEYLWRADVSVTEGTETSYRICAADAVGNEACSDERIAGTDEDKDDDLDGAKEPPPSGGCNAAGMSGHSVGAMIFAILFFAYILTRRRKR